MRNFEPDVGFSEVWLPYFSNHTGISPFEFMLEEDVSHFSDTADRMEKRR
jgi:hypothetical protein